jgi:hypothetical protein
MAAGGFPMAAGPGWYDDGGVPAWNSFSFAFGPFIAVLLVGLFALILRWAFSRGSSVVAAAPRPGPDADYGLLVPVASPGSFVEGEILRQRLAAQGVARRRGTRPQSPGRLTRQAMSSRRTSAPRPSSAGTKPA